MEQCGWASVNSDHDGLSSAQSRGECPLESMDRFPRDFEQVEGKIQSLSHVAPIQEWIWMLGIICYFVARTAFYTIIGATAYLLLNLSFN